MPESTALLIFAQTASKDAKDKSILSVKRNLPFFEALNAHTGAQANAAGIDAFWFTEKHQKGQGFGERITHAISEVLDKGFQNVIVIGNDCPDLQVADILLAREKVQGGQLVLGPDQRGGAYLIGLSKEIFQQKEFEAIPWQTSKTLDALAALHEPKACFLLGQKHDLNNASDAKELVQLSSVFQCILVRLSKTEKALPTYINQAFTTVLSQALLLRAPPLTA